MQHHPFLGKRIVVFTAHPDDEMIVAGTMYANHRAGGETFLICATYGEKGKSHLAKPVSDAALARIRKAELLAAAKALKIDKVLFLGLPDAGVRAHKRELFEKALPLIKKLKPDYLLSFGPDGMSGHLDHITVGEAALRVAKKLNVPLAAFTSGMPATGGIAKAGMKLFKLRRKFGKYAKTTPDFRKSDIKVKVDTNVKLRAMRSHVSQFGNGGFFLKLPKAVVARWMSYEHFVQEKI